MHFVDSSHSLDERIRHALMRQQYLIGRKVRVSVTAEEVVLTGRVDTYFQKQMAQETLRRIAGVNRIVNDLEVITR